MTDFLELENKTIAVFGVANRKSVAYHIARTLDECGANVIHVVRNEEIRSRVSKLFPERSVLACDVEHDDQLARLTDEIRERAPAIHGLVHSIAFADYDGTVKPFHETSKSQFLRAVDISCFSLIAISRALQQQFHPQASVVTVSISTTKMASENYGFMAPVKAALDSSLAFLAKSFSRFSEVRFNAIAPSLLKTSASAGIPGYVNAYLYAEQVIPRGRAVKTQEVANAACFLLSPRASGINAQTVVVDAAMAINYFDERIIQRVLDSQHGA